MVGQGLGLGFIGGWDLGFCWGSIGGEIPFHFWVLCVHVRPLSLLAIEKCFFFRSLLSRCLGFCMGDLQGDFVGRPPLLLRRSVSGGSPGQGLPLFVEIACAFVGIVGCKPYLAPGYGYLDSVGQGLYVLIKQWCK